MQTEENIDMPSRGAVNPAHEGQPSLVGCVDKLDAIACRVDFVMNALPEDRTATDLFFTLLSISDDIKTISESVQIHTKLSAMAKVATMPVNYDSALAQMREGGLRIDNLETGHLVRCRIKDDRGVQLAGWYELHEVATETGETMLVGCFGDYRQGEGFKVNINIDLTAQPRRKRENVEVVI